MAMGWLSLSGVGVFGTFLAARKDNRQRGAKFLKHGLWIGVVGLLSLYALFTVGCGGTSSTSSRQQKSTVTVMLTGKSGSISHSTPITLTIQ